MGKSKSKTWSEDITIRSVYGLLSATAYINETKKRIDVVIHNDEKSVTGTAICHENDEFSIKWGIELAKKKARKNLYSTILSEVQSQLKAAERGVSQLQDLIQIEKAKINYSLSKKYPPKVEEPADPTVEVEINEILENEQEVEVKQS